MAPRCLVLVLALAACGGPPTPAAEPAPTRRVVEDSTDASDDSGDGEDDGLELVSDRGRVDPDVAAQKIGPHAEALNACYADRLQRRKWLGGSVELTWDLAADGTLVGVRVGHSDLGAWPIEKCLLAVARGVGFGQPIGGKADVTFPVSFSAGSMALGWDDDQAVRAVGGKPVELGGCAKVGGGDPSNVTVTVYVGTRGKVQSVGFASPTGFDDAWADCAAGRAMTWALTDPRGKVAKASFVYNPAAIADEDEEF